MISNRTFGEVCRSFRVVTGLTLAFFALLATATPRSANALLVGTTPNVVPNTTSNPLNNPIWAVTGKGDPGYANEGRASFGNGVYIGDGWILNAAHVGQQPISFVDGGTIYQPVPNQGFFVPNPTGIAGLNTTNADLYLYRINNDPGLPSLKIASQQLALNDEVMFIATGVLRASAESAWTTDNADPPTWTSVGSCSGGPNNHCFHGYLASGTGKAWGTNNVGNDSIVGGNGSLTTVVNGGTIGNLVSYDQNSVNPFEAQVVGGDSGSAVFHKNGSQWELAGITLANFIYKNQESIQFNQAALYGNASAFADLATYNSGIAAILTAHQDYSVVGDLNLDGVVDQNDLNTFVANWGFSSGTGGSMITWKKGDLNHDGKVDVSDFFRWRNEAPSSIISSGALASMFGISAGNLVPEPATIILLLIPALAWFGTRGHRTSLC
jgi:hypothetical protein